MAGIFPHSVPSAPSSSTQRPRTHHKRVSFSRLSSDTTASLPPYRSALPPPLESYPSEQPPDYPDSAEEADEESDLQPAHLISPPTSPRPKKKKLYRPDFHSRQSGIYASSATQSDVYLDRILERSVAALEYSNTLLQSSLSTDLSKLDQSSSPEDTVSNLRPTIGSRAVSERLRGNRGTQDRWRDDLEALNRDLDELCGPSTRPVGVNIRHRRTATNDSEASISRSLPSSAPFHSPKRPRRRVSVDVHRNDSGRLQLDSNDKRLFSHPPRALTQYVHADAVFGDDGSPSNHHTILLPSTNGLRSSSHVSDFGSPSTSTSALPSLPPSPSPQSSAYALLSRHARRSPRSAPSSRSPSLSGSSSCTYRQRSSSRSSHRTASPHFLPRLIPPPIEELPSQSESSSSDSPNPYRTVESLRKILDVQPSSPADLKGKSPAHKSTTHMPALQPRSPPVGPVSSTSTTTTSISRLFTKGAHSTTTRPRSPPRHSSLKRRPPQLDTTHDSPNADSASLLLIPSPSPSMSSVTPSAPSSGRSTPRRVGFGPLPEPVWREGERSVLREHQEARAKAKALQRSKAVGSHRGTGSKDRTGKTKEGESSWWTTWLVGGSGLSMSAGRQEERVEDRMARSWGRPGLPGAGFEDWPV